jgi:dTDP-glucose 4,6-dehydratase
VESLRFRSYRGWSLKKTSVVLGAAGFLGSHLCDALIESQHFVFAIDDLSSGHKANLEQLSDRADFEFLYQDICSPISVERDVDYVFNFASLASPPRYLKQPVHTLRTGSIGMENAIKLALAKNARLIHASTSEVYGDPLQHPQREDYWGNVNPIGERSCYDEAKRFAEALCVAYSKTESLDVGIIRIFNTYGPRLDPHDGRVISNFVSQALRGEDLTIYGDGTQTRSFCFVSDLIKGIQAMASSNLSGPVNLGNPKEYSVFETANRVIKRTKSESQIVYLDLPSDDPKMRRPDISLAKSALGWSPSIEIDEGIDKLIGWYTSGGRK